MNDKNGKSELVEAYKDEWHTQWVKSDRETEISYDVPYRLNLRRNDTNELTYKTDSQPERTDLWLLGGGLR